MVVFYTVTQLVPKSYVAPESLVSTVLPFSAHYTWEVGEFLDEEDLSVFVPCEGGTAASSSSAFIGLVVRSRSEVNALLALSPTRSSPSQSAAELVPVPYNFCKHGWSARDFQLEASLGIQNLLNH